MLNGNTKEVKYEDEGHEYYQYDDYNRLIELTQPDGMVYEYTYDAQDERVKEIVVDLNVYHYPTYYSQIKELDVQDIRQKVGELELSTSFEILADQMEIKEEAGGCKVEEVYEKDNAYMNEAKSYNYELDRTQEYTQVLSKNGENSYYGLSRLNTEDTLYITGKNQTVYKSIEKDVVTSYHYDDFGNNNTKEVSFGYNGDVHDESGLIYLRARYYNPIIGRFIQIDSYKGQMDNVESQNRYIYTLNNPYKYVDRDGNRPSPDKLGAKRPTTTTNTGSATTAGTTTIVGKLGGKPVSYDKIENPYNSGIYALNFDNILTWATVIPTPISPAAATIKTGAIIWDLINLVPSINVPAPCIRSTSAMDAGWKDKFLSKSKEATLEGDGTLTSSDESDRPNILDKVKEKLEDIAGSYGNGECDKAVDAMTSYLDKQGIKYEIISITIVNGVSDIVWCVSKDMAVGTNKFHMGVVLNEMLAFCNIHPYGLPVRAWVADFIGTGKKVVTPTKYQD